MSRQRLSRLQLTRFSGIAWRLAWRVLWVLGIGLLLGWLFDHSLRAAGWWLALVLGVYLLTQLRNLWELDRWVRFRNVLHPPDFTGPWGDLTAVIARIYQRKQFHKQRVTNLLREFRRLTTGMPDGVALLGRNNELLWFNQHAEDWLGLKRKRDVGLRIENLVRYPAFVDYLIRGDYTQAAVVQQPGPAQRWLSFHVVQSEGSVQKLLVVRDVTKEKRLEVMRKDFVANASHELRSPLTVISGYLDALADEVAHDQTLKSAWQEPVTEMRRQSERMRSLIEQLLQLSRIESSNEVLAEQRVDVPGLLALIRKDALSLEQRPAQITLQLDSDACLCGSETELQSVFANLVNNAIKYTPAGGSITLRWWQDGYGAHLAVSDTGIGIAAEHLPRLTERFYRVDEGRSREQGGFGLGLSIVRHVLQRHDATLSIDSEPGKGSTFTCHFPPARVVQREERGVVSAG